MYLHSFWLEVNSVVCWTILKQTKRPTEFKIKQQKLETQILTYPVELIICHAKLRGQLSSAVASYERPEKIHNPSSHGSG